MSKFLTYYSSHLRHCRPMLRRNGQCDTHLGAKWLV